MKSKKQGLISEKGSIAENLDQRPSVLLILIGLPASGKSTLAKILIDFPQINKLFINKSIIDIDLIRTELFGNYFKPENEKAVQDEKFKRVSNHINPNSLVIVDDLHYYISMRHRYFELSKEKKAIFLSLYFTTPLSVCKRWNIRRGIPIPNTLIEDINDKFDFPGLKYRWDKPDLIIDFSQTDLEKAIDSTLEMIDRKIQQYTNVIQKDLGKTQVQSLNTHNNSQKISLNSTNFEIIENKAREFIRSIKNNEVNEKKMNKLNKIFLNKYNFSIISEKANKILSNYKKKYIKSIKSTSFSDFSLDDFIEFINRNLQSSN